MNFRDLEYVIEVSRALSFVQAARTCNVSQPTLSAQIKKLEQELGAEIFIRNNRKVYLTAYGKDFVKQAQDILAIRSDMIDRSKEKQEFHYGNLRLGAILTAAPYMFPNIVNTVQEKLPNLKLSLIEATTEALIGLLLKDEIDAAIISLPTDTNIFEAHSLLSESFYLAVPSNHKLAHESYVDETMLDNERLILLEEGHCFRNQALEVCYSSSAKINETFAATSLETIRFLLQTGKGITLMPAMATRDDDNIRYIPFKNQKFSREIGLIWRKNSLKKNQLDKLVSVL